MRSSTPGAGGEAGAIEFPGTREKTDAPPPRPPSQGNGASFATAAPGVTLAFPAVERETPEPAREIRPGRLAPRLWREADDHKLRRLVARGVAVKLIARELGRGPGAVATRMRKLKIGVKDARHALWAREKARRAQLADPIAYAVAWLVGAGIEVEWVHPNHVKVAPSRFPVPVDRLPEIARARGAPPRNRIVEQ